MYWTFQQVFISLTALIAIIAFVRFFVRRYVRFDPGTWKRGTAPRFIFVFAVGISFGFAIASLLMSSYSPYDAMRALDMSRLYNLKDSTNEVTALHHTMELNSTFANELLRGMEEITARRMAKEVRVLCWVLTHPGNHQSKAFHVKATWGRHCNILLFISDGEDPDLPIPKLNVAPGRDGLWNKSVSAFSHVYEKYQDQYDWVMKADDDTYVLVENLRSMLLPYSPNDPIYFGFQFKPYIKQGYMSGGAGYVLSKEAVKRAVTQAFHGKNMNCPSGIMGGAEDVNMGKCLEAVGVIAGDSRDSKGRGRFFPFDVEGHVNPDQGNKNWWYWDYIYWPINGGLDCCSDKPISFHYLNPTKMYMLEYLAYHVNPFPVMHLSMAEAPPKEEPKSETKEPEPEKKTEEKKPEDEKKIEEKTPEEKKPEEKKPEEKKPEEKKPEEKKPEEKKPEEKKPEEKQEEKKTEEKPKEEAEKKQR